MAKKKTTPAPTPAVAATPNVRGMYRIIYTAVRPIVYELQMIDGEMRQTRRVLNKGEHDVCANCGSPAIANKGTWVVGRGQRAYVCNKCETQSDPNGITTVVDTLIAEKPYVEGEEDQPSETDS